MSFVTATHIILILFFVQFTTDASEAITFDKLNSGFESAGKFLGLDKTAEIAQLISNAFSKPSSAEKKGDRDEEGHNIFAGFLRIFGFDSKKIGAIAINALIFVAQMIKSSLARKQVLENARQPQLKQGSPLEWLMNSTSAKHMKDSVLDTDLPNNIIKYIKERSLDEDTGCIQLLVCKGAPLVWSMQRALRHKPDEQLKGKTALFGYLPSLEEVADHADKCEEKYPYCFFLNN